MGKNTESSQEEKNIKTKLYIKIETFLKEVSISSNINYWLNNERLTNYAFSDKVRLLSLFWL